MGAQDLSADSKLETQESFWHSSTVGTGKADVFNLGLKAEKKPSPSSRWIDKSSLLPWRQSSFYVIQALNWLDVAHSLREGNLLYSVYEVNVNVTQKHPHVYPEWCFNKCLGTSWLSQVDV